MPLGILADAVLLCPAIILFNMNNRLSESERKRELALHINITSFLSIILIIIHKYMMMIQFNAHTLPFSLVSCLSTALYPLWRLFSDLQVFGPAPPSNSILAPFISKQFNQP